MNRFVQALRFLTTGALATGNVGVCEHACHAGAQAIELYSKVVAGVERRETLVQCHKRRARIGSVRIGRQKSLGLQFGRQFLLGFASASVRVGGIFRVLILLHPFDGIERMPALGTGRACISLCRGGRARARRTLRCSTLRAYGQEKGNTRNQYCYNQQRSFHSHSSVEDLWTRLGDAASSSSRPRRVGQSVLSKRGTPPIGHAGRSYRLLLARGITFPIGGCVAGSNANVVLMEKGSGFHAENEAIDRHAKASKEEEWGAVLRY